MGQELSPDGHIPLNEETLSKMVPGERAFWDKFLPLASEEIDKAVENETEIPYRPSPELQSLYETAITAYKGSSYCQVNQLMNIFSFNTRQ